MEAIYNFRDFGGYPTRNGKILKKGLLYRSGDLARATEADFARISALGIKTVYDLRSEEERAKEPDRIPETAAFELIHLPMIPVVEYHGRSLRRLFSLMFGRERRTDYVAVLHQAYRGYATEYLPQMKSLLQRISDPKNLPVLIHCSAGKDRTGVVVGLIQLALGVPRESVVEDYVKTNGKLDEYIADIHRRLSRLGIFGIPWKRLYGPLFAARPDFILAALQGVKEEFGGVDAWLQRGLGFSEKERLALVRATCDSVR